jgi:hypothetical protein
MNVSFNEMHEFYNEFQAFLSANLFVSQLSPNFLTLKGPPNIASTESIPCENQFRIGIDSGEGEREIRDRSRFQP